MSPKHDPSVLVALSLILVAIITTYHLGAIFGQSPQTLHLTIDLTWGNPRNFPE